MTLRPRLAVAIAVAAFVAATAAISPAGAQCVSLTTLGSASTQNFDSLSNVAGSTTNNLTIPGWFLTEGGGGARDNEQYAVDTGASGTGDMYSYGAAGSTERALGELRSGTLIPLFGACFTNNTGGTITSLAVAYTGEEWRCGTAARSDQFSFEYSTNATDLVTGTWTGVAALNFASPDTAAVGAKNGNAAGDRTALSTTIASLSIANGATFWIRWTDTDATGADDGLAVDDFSLTPNGTVAGINLTINDVALDEGNAGTTNFTFTVSLSAPAAAGGVTFDIATADGTAQDDNPPAEDNDYVPGSLTGQNIPAGSSTYAFTVAVNGDTTPETNETFFVNVTNATGTGVTVTDGQGQGTIVNDDLTKIHDVQGNGAATPIPGATVLVEGVVVANFQSSTQLQGFFLEEEDADFDADPATSEGIFVFCSSCPTPVAEGQRVRASGTVSEFVGMTEISATTAGSVVITGAGNHLAEVTPAAIDLPVAGVVDDFYEAREGMLVTFVDTLSVSEYFELGRYGQIVLVEGGRPFQFTETAPPNVAGYTAHLDAIARRQVILDDDDSAQESYLALPDGQQFIFHPRANGGFSVGTQGIDFFRGGDLVSGLTGVLHWSFPGFGANTWRIRPTAAHPVAFTVANPRPATPPAVGGAIRVAGMNLLNYFTTIDTTASNTSGPCGPSGTLDCRGADSVAELNRQRERASIVVCTLNADAYGFMELENTTPSATITDLLGAINARCGGAHPYAFVNTGGTLGTDAIRVQLIYRTGVLSPVGSPLVDLDPIHNRPPTAQTFDVVDAANPAFGQRFTLVANHFKSKGCDASATGPDADAGDGQSCYAGRRTAQATRLLTWIASTVLPAAGDPDVVLVGDFNSYAQETPVATLTSGGFVDVETALLGSAAYSYLFDAELGHLDYAFANAAMFAQVTGVGAWHINADEAELFDYNDEVADAGEASFEEKPDGSALVPPRVVFQPGTPYRASDHDPVLLGIFQVADLAVTKTDSPDPVAAGTNLAYTVTVTNNGPDAAAAAAWSDTLPAGTVFVSQPPVAGWSCTTPAVGSGGTVSCSNPSFAVGSAVFTLTVQVSPAVAAGTVLSNTATATSTTGDPNAANNSATATTTVATAADLSVTQVDTPDPVIAGTNLTYTITVANAGPSQAATIALSDTLPAGTTFVSLPSVAGWSCTTPAVGSGGTVSCSIAALPAGSTVFTLTVAVDAGVASGTVLSNTATVSSATTDPNPGNGSSTATTTVSASADLSLTQTDAPDPVVASGPLAYTITLANAGPSQAAGVSLADTLPAGTTFVSLASPGGWSCSTPAVGAGGTVSCTDAALDASSAVFTLTVRVDPCVAAGTVISNTATATSSTTDPNPGDESATATTTAQALASAITFGKSDAPDPVFAGGNLTYSLTATSALPGNLAGATLSDPLPAGTTYVSHSAPAGWSCTAPAVGANGTVSCTATPYAPGSAAFTLVVAVAASTPGGTVVGNTATLTLTDGACTQPSTAAASTTVDSPASLVAEKSVAGTFEPGGAIAYTIVLTNTSTSAQGDNPGDEFVDVLPAELALVSATATSGTAVATVGTNTVTWNGAIPAGGTVTITVQATISDAVAPGATIVNQGTVAYDADGNGTNEATAPTDDPAAGGAADPTAFVVGGGVPIQEIPALDRFGLLGLAVGLAALALFRLGRRRRPLGS
jgi:uncharacterized repeat protein (TIGR01451 family)